MSVQYADDSEPQPRSRVRSLVRAALPDGGEVVVRFVRQTEMATLNHQTRGKTGATNILSFAYPSVADNIVRGDIVICPQIATRDAVQYQKPPAHHLAHLIVHGVLHLAGYRHDTATTAAKMEAAERTILQRFNIADPYLLP